MAHDTSEHRVGRRRFLLGAAAAAALGITFPDALRDVVQAHTLNPSRLLVPDQASAALAGLDTTGSSDATAFIQAIINATPDNSTLTFPAGAVVRVDGTLQVVNRSQLTFEGSGCTLQTSDPSTNGVERHFWLLQNSANITFRNFIMHGANPNAGLADAAYDPTREHQHGWAIYGGGAINIDTCTCTDIYGDFVYLSPLLTGTHALPTFISVHDCTFQRNGRHGISFTGASGVLIQNNTITDVRMSALDFEPTIPQGEVHRTTIDSNTFGPMRLPFCTGTGGTPGVAMSDIAITNNQLTDPMQSPLRITFGRTDVRRSNITVTGNVSASPYASSTSFAMQFVDVDGVTVVANQQPLAGPNMWLVDQVGCTGLLVFWNAIPGGVGQLESV
jgi:parallel beta-helix repeat protein